MYNVERYCTSLYCIENPYWIGRRRGKKISHWGRYLAQKKHSRKITPSILTPFSELLPNLYYSPIKKLENIFIFKIARQHHP